MQYLSPRIIFLIAQTKQSASLGNIEILLGEIGARNRFNRHRR